MTILLYIIIGMLSFYVGYVIGNLYGYRDGLKDSSNVFSEVIAEVITMKTETIVVEKEGRQKDEA